MSDDRKPEVKMEPMFLPGVENNPQPGPYTDALRMMQAAGPEYPQIWHMFAFKPEATGHLAIRRRSCANRRCYVPGCGS
jgi:hypothetical protein